MDITQIIKEAVTISEHATFTEAVELMIKRQTNSLLVVNESNELVGEVSVTDLLDAIVPEYLDGDSIAAHFAGSDMFDEAVHDTAGKEVQYFMDRNVEAVRKDEGIMAIASAAIAHHKARIPVVDEQNHPIGIISRRGLKHIIASVLNIEDSNE